VLTVKDEPGVNSCEYCLSQADFAMQSFAIEHIIPLRTQQVITHRPICAGEHWLKGTLDLCLN